jgi:hypothetical protein
LILALPSQDVINAKDLHAVYFQAVNPRNLRISVEQRANRVSVLMRHNQYADGCTTLELDRHDPMHRFSEDGRINPKIQSLLVQPESQSGRLAPTDHFIVCQRTRNLDVRPRGIAVPDAEQEDSTSERKQDSEEKLHRRTAGTIHDRFGLTAIIDPAV